MCLICQNCSKPFQPKQRFRKDRPQKFCSSDCSNKFRSSANHPHYKGGCIFNGYRLIRIPLNGKSVQVKEHRWIMEQHLKRKLTKHEHIHHIDGDKANNAISNLRIVTCGEHSKIHGSFRNLTHKECAKCHQIKERSYFTKANKNLPINNDPHISYCKSCVCKITSKYYKL